MKRFVIILLLFTPQMLAAASTARGTVEYFQSKLLESTHEAQYGARIAYLEPVVTETFSIETVARIALGRNWRGLNEDQRERIERAMTRLVVSSYAGQFVNPGHRFHINETRALKADRMIVRTSLIAAEGQLVDLDYQLVHRDDEWRIYDVVANGVSDLSMKRSVYATEFAENGFEGVLATIRSNIEENEP